MIDAPSKQEARRLCVLRWGWGRWLLEPAPYGPGGEIPDELDEESVARGQARHEAVTRWVREGGDLPWEEST
jgi:hypothetical protein